MSINQNDFVDFLETYLMEEEAKELEIKITGDEETDAPMINSKDKANYFLKLMMNIKTDIDQINTICDSEIAKTTQRVESFREEQLKTLTKQYSYYEKILQNFTEHEIVNSKKKSIPLAYGTLSIKAQPAKWEYDDAVLLNWAKENLDGLVNTKVVETVMKAELKTAVKDGLLDAKNIPGVNVIEQPAKFNVKIK